LNKPDESGFGARVRFSGTLGKTHRARPRRGLRLALIPRAKRAGARVKRQNSRFYGVEGIVLA
jgi:hypothetical protein